MIKRINFQTINQNGQPAFVVIPYHEFLQLYPQLQEDDEVWIPHEIIMLMVKKDISQIQAWREYLGFSQKEVAAKMGISQAALSQIETKDSRPRKATLLKLAEIYNLKLDHLR